jgi:hypothetical protein
MLITEAPGSPSNWIMTVRRDDRPVQSCQRPSTQRATRCLVRRVRHARTSWAPSNADETHGRFSGERHRTKSAVVDAPAECAISALLRT